MSNINVTSIAISGLNAEAQTVANASSNIVNASSTAPLPQNANNYTGFTPQDVITISTPGAGGVTTATTPVSPAYVTAYDPNSPQANAQGLVAAPNVDLANEAVTENNASINYGADAAVIKIANKMEKSLLDIIT